MFALEYLSSEGDGTLAALAVETLRRKLAGGLSSPFREQLQQCFDSCITSQASGAEPGVLTAEGRVRKPPRAHLLAPAPRTGRNAGAPLIPDGCTYGSTPSTCTPARPTKRRPPGKSSGPNRIKKAEPTDTLRLSCESLQDDGFAGKQQHSFAGVFGDTLFDVTLRFTGNAMHYVLERQWHPSQADTPLRP